jgi:hypothetical protein
MRCHRGYVIIDKIIMPFAIMMKDRDGSVLGG